MAVPTVHILISLTKDQGLYISFLISYFLLETIKVSISTRIQTSNEKSGLSEVEPLISKQSFLFLVSINK